MKKYLYVFFITIIIFIIVFVLYFFNEGINVVIKNNSSVVIEKIDVKYTGGVKTIDFLNINEVKSTKIISTGESSMDLYIYYKNKTNQHCAINTYFESSYTGSIEIVVNKDLCVKTKDDIKIY